MWLDCVMYRRYHTAANSGMCSGCKVPVCMENVVAFFIAGWSGILFDLTTIKKILKPFCLTAYIHRDLEEKTVHSTLQSLVHYLLHSKNVYLALPFKANDSSSKGDNAVLDVCFESEVQCCGFIYRWRSRWRNLRSRNKCRHFPNQI